MHSFSAKKAILIALGVFVASFALEAELWLHFTFVDQAAWVYATESLSQGRLDDGIILRTGYPATTILIPASALIRLGVDAKVALRIVLAFLLAFTTACIALAAYRARSDTLWWLALAALFSTHHFYSSPDPPSLVIGPLAALLVVMLVNLSETPGARTTQVLVGCVLGAMLATRLDISALFALATALLLYSSGRAREILPVALTAAVALIILDPLLWLEPATQIASFFAKIYKATAHTVWAPFVPGDLRVLAPWLALAALAIAPAMNLRLRAATRVSTRFIAWLLAATAVFCGVLLSFPFHPIAYFFPLITPWEALFALYGLIFIAEMRLPARLEGLRRTALPLVFALFIIVSQFPNSMIFDRIAALMGG